MIRRRKTYSIKNGVSAILMILTLLWLTVSIPFVNAAQQKQAVTKSSTAQDKEDSGNPLAGATEEKTPSSVNLSEEYLHDHGEHAYNADSKLNHSHYHSYDVYVAFHGELLSPPPEA